MTGGVASSLPARGGILSVRWCALLQLLLQDADAFVLGLDRSDRRGEQRVEIDGVAAIGDERRIRGIFCQKPEALAAARLIVVAIARERQCIDLPGERVEVVAR